MKYAVICLVHGKVELSDQQYEDQMSAPDSRWVCPECGNIAQWDDDTYEAYLDSLPDNGDGPFVDWPKDD
jgi:hypothetical protein